MTFLPAVLAFLTVTLGLSADPYGYGYGIECAEDVEGYGCEHSARPRPAPAPAPKPATPWKPAPKSPRPWIAAPAPSPEPESELIRPYNDDKDDDVPSSTQKCGYRVPDKCVFPFIYKNLEYHSCTGIDAVNTKWCSTDAIYKGHWKQCDDPCQKLPVQQIVTGVVASGVAATGIGLIAAAIHKNMEDAALKAATTIAQTILTTVAPTLTTEVPKPTEAPTGDETAAPTEAPEAPALTTAPEDKGATGGATTAPGTEAPATEAPTAAATTAPATTAPAAAALKPERLYAAPTTVDPYAALEQIKPDVAGPTFAPVVPREDPTAEKKQKNGKQEKKDPLDVIEKAATTEAPKTTTKKSAPAAVPSKTALAITTEEVTSTTAAATTTEELASTAAAATTTEVLAITTLEIAGLEPLEHVYDQVKLEVPGPTFAPVQIADPLTKEKEKPAPESSRRLFLQ